MRLIDADKLLEKLSRTSVFEYITNAADKNVFKIIDEQPTVEVQQWIPCSERLPELCDGTEAFKQSKMLLITCEWYDGDIVTDIGWYNQSGKWNADSENCKVIAWMDAPKPYKGVSE